MPDRSCQALSRIALALVLAFTSAAAGGAEKAKKSAPAKTGSSPLLTPAQLRECLAQEERLRDLTADALKDKAIIEAERAQIARLGATLGEQVVTLDRTSVDAVDAYNRMAVERDALIDPYQARVTEYNLKAGNVKLTQEAYQKACDKRRYDERDLNDVQRKK